MYRYIFKLLVVWCFWWGVFACSVSPSEVDKPVAKQKSVEAKAVSVKVALAQERFFVFTLQNNGKIEAMEQSQIQSRTQGYIKKLWVMNGALVQKGQLICQLDDAEAQLALAKAQNQRASAYEEYIKEVLDYKGNLSLPNGGLSVDLHERIYVRKGLKAADLQLKEAQLQLSYTQIVAPFGGKIADLSMKQDNYVSPQQNICTLYNSQDLYAQIEVLESELTHLQIGQAAMVKTLYCPDKDKSCLSAAKVIEINPKIQTNGLFKVRLGLSQPTGFFIGMNVLTEIYLPQKQALSVPKEAILLKGGQKVVFVAENKLAKWRYVRTGLENNREVEILEGIKANEKVIIENNLPLAHDSNIIEK